MKITTIVSVAVAIVASTVSISAAVAAPAGSEASAVRVSYADLNLGSVTGKAVLERRIAAAASKVCGYDKAERDLAMHRETATCYRGAVAKAQTDVATATQPMFASR